MKLSRLVLLAAGCAVAALPSLRAADEAGTGSAPTDRPRAERRWGGGGPRGMLPPAAMEKLGLTEDQKAKIKTIREKYQPQLEALRNEASLEREARREKAQPLFEAMRKEIHAVLTAEQAAKLEEMRKNAPMRRPGGPGARRGPPPPDQGDGPAEPPPPPPQ